MLIWNRARVYSGRREEKANRIKQLRPPVRFDTDQSITVILMEGLMTAHSPPSFIVIIVVIIIVTIINNDQGQLTKAS
jgi:hypothetical protein